MIKHLFLTIYLTFTLTGLFCQGKSGFERIEQDSKNVKITKTIPFRKDSVKVDDFLFAVKKMEINNDVLVTVNNTDEPIFRVFSLNNCEKIGAFGKTGKGPDDFNSVIFNGFNIRGNTIIATDLSSIKTIDLKAKAKPAIINTIKIPETLLPFNDAIKLNDTIILGTGNASSKEFVYYNSISHKIDNMVDFPEFIKNVPEVAKERIYSKVIDVSPDHRTIVCAYKLFPCLRILDLTTLKSIMIQVDTRQKPTIRNVDNSFTVGMNDRITFYDYISVSNNYIIAKLNSQKFSGIKNNELQMEQLMEPEIHIFTITGEPIARIIVPTCYKSFVYDEKRNRLIMINPDMDEFLFFTTLTTD